MYRYAQINKNGYVVSNSCLSGEVTAENMIPIPEEFDITDKKYVNGQSTHRNRQLRNRVSRQLCRPRYCLASRK